MKKRFSLSVNIAKTRSFPGADIGSNHKLVMMTFKLHLKKTKKQGHERIRFDVDKLKDPHVAEVFQAMIGGKFAALSIVDSDMDFDTLTDTFNAAVTIQPMRSLENITQSRSHGSPLRSSICVTNGGN